MMNVAMYFQGYANSCYYVNYMDLSPRFSAVLCGIGNGLCAVSGLLGPVFVGLLLQGVPSGGSILNQICVKVAPSQCYYHVF